MRRSRLAPLLFTAASCACSSNPTAHPASTAPLLLSHAWIVVPSPATERSALEAAGFQIAPTVHHHDGQGTSSITVELENGYLELIYPDAAVSVSPGREAGAQKFRAKSRWRDTGYSPIGVVFDRTPSTPTQFPFPTWRVSAEWMEPGTSIEMLTPKEMPTAVSLSISPHAQSVVESNASLLRDPEQKAVFEHPNRARRITSMRVVAPDAAGLPPSAAYLAEQGLLKFDVGPAWLLEVTLDHARKNTRRDLRPELPLVIRY